MIKFPGQKIYLIGIKGVGLTMLAQFLAKTGHNVSGSDTTEVFLTDRILKKEHIKVKAPFAATNLPQQADVIIYSSAYSPENNPEIAYLKKHAADFKRTAILSYGAALGALFNQYQGIAVCGSHGKTTTSAWLGYVLQKAGLAPNVLVGSRVPQFQGSGLVGCSPYFIAEVDEYQNKLRYFKPQGVVLNNIDYDHPDFFKSRAAYTAVFREFLKKVPRHGFLVVNQADKEIRKIKKYCSGKIISYAIQGSTKLDASREAPVDYLAHDLRLQNNWQFFKVTAAGRNRGEFKSRLVGQHNVANALAVIAAAEYLGAPRSAVKKYLASFQGTERRHQILGRYHGALIIDDYAHHPTEIQATLAGLKGNYPQKRLSVVFHPHTFTRTQVFFKDFVKSFALVDQLIILDIYGSAREKQGGVSSRKLVAEINKYNQRQGRHQTVLYLPTAREARAHLQASLGVGDLLVLMGAGDVFRIGQALLS